MASSRCRDGQGAFWGDCIGPNPTDRAKNGVKRSLLVEADGGPLAVVVAGANVHDTKLLEATLEAIVVERQPITTTNLTFGGSAKKSWIARDARDIPPAVGSWSVRWVG